MARRTKRTKEARERIVSLLKAGTTRKAAYTAAGMSHDTFAEWIKAEEGFDLEVQQAEQEAIARNVALVQRAAQPRPVRKTITKTEKDGSVTVTVEEHTEDGDWRASAWFLEKRDPANHGRRLDVTSNGETIKGYGASVDFDDI